MRGVVRWSLAALFLVEVGAWASYGVWGAAVGPGWLLGWLLPLLVVVVWWLAAAPRAPLRWKGLRATVKVVVFLGAVLALTDAGRSDWAVGLAVAVVASHGLAHAVGADPVAAVEQQT